MSDSPSNDVPDSPVHIFDLNPPILDPDHQRRLWTFYRPEVVTLFNQMAARETWIPEFLDNAMFSAISDLLQVVAQHGVESVTDEHLARLAELLAQIGVRQCIYALTWMERQAGISAQLLAWAFRVRAEDPSANVLCQRVERLAQYHILEDLVAFHARDQF